MLLSHILRTLYKMEHLHIMREQYENIFIKPFSSVGLEGGAALNVVKIKAYDRNPHTVNELKDCISDAITEIDGERNLCHAVCQSVLDRYEDCCRVEVGHFEYLRD